MKELIHKLNKIIKDNCGYHNRLPEQDLINLIVNTIPILDHLIYVHVYKYGYN